MNIGDYVRFYNRGWTEIGQIVDEVEDSHLKVVKCKDGFYDLDNFIKSSPNIIDLIEVGDYVNGRKVYQVGYNFQDDLVLKMSINKDGIPNNYEDFIYEKDIKSIVTKECFESMEYKVGE